MDNKFKKATKRIAAVAASAAVVSSTAFAAGLSNYPSNFVQDGKFNGQVVVGAAAQAVDTTSAQSIIDDLSAELSGEAGKVKITYKDASEGGESVQILDSGKVMKYGQDLNDVKPTAMDDKDMDVLADGTFNNGADDVDYEQTVSFTNNSYFEHALRDDKADEISSHLWLEDSDVMTYTVSMKSSVNYDSTVTNWDSDFVGETIDILGNEYTIISVTSGTDNNGDEGFTALELIGGSNKVSLGEGESTTVTVDGNEYEVSIQSVATDKVLLTVNGESKSIDEYDTEEVGGVTIAVTDLISSSRDAVKGYAEIVLGGNKIKLTDNAEVEINDQDISDLYENYRATASFSNSGAAAGAEAFDGFSITYTLDDEMLLAEGDSFMDNVFGVLGIRYDGTNNVEYESIKLSASSDKLGLSGTTLGGDEFDEDVAMLYDDTTTNTPTVLIGASDDDRLLVSDFSAVVVASTFTENGNVQAIDADLGLYLDSVTDATNNDATIDSITINGQTFTSVSDGNIEVGNYLVSIADPGADTTANTVNIGVVGINLPEANGMRFITGDRDAQQMYEIGTYSISSEEVDFEDVLTADQDADISADSIASKLDDVATATYSAGNHNLTALDAMETEVLFANEYVVSLEGVAATSTTASAGGAVYVYADSSDLNADDETTANGETFNAVATDDVGDFPAWTFNLRFDTTDDMFDVELVTGESKEVLLSGAEADVSASNDNEKEYVDAYGTIVKVDAEDKEWVEISTPDRQVEGQVYLTAGGSSVDTMTVTVDASEADAKVAELEEDGYTVVSTEDVEAESAEFDITAPVFDSDVSGTEDMIVVGGPAVNSVAASLLGMSFPTYGVESGVGADEAVVRYFEESNTVLVYGYEGKDTAAAADKLNAGGLSGTSVNVAN